MEEFLLQRRDSHFRGATTIEFARDLTWLKVLRLPRRARGPQTALEEFVSDGGAAETLNAGSDFSVIQQKIPNGPISFNFVTRFFRLDLRVIGRSSLRSFWAEKLDSGFSGHSPMYSGKSGSRLRGK